VRESLGTLAKRWSSGASLNFFGTGSLTEHPVLMLKKSFIPIDEQHMAWGKAE